MGSGVTTKYALPYPLGTDNPNIPGDIQDLANAVNSIFASYSSGALAARPVAALSGRFYKQTDDITTTWIDDGASWRSVGSRVIANSSSDIGQIVKGVVSQSVDLQQYQNSVGTVLGRVDPSGNVGITGKLQVGDPTIPTGVQAIIKGVSTNIPLQVKRATGQTVDLIQVLSDVGAVLAKVDQVGGGTFASLVSGGNNVLTTASTYASTVAGRSGAVALTAADIAAGTFPTGAFAIPGSLTVAGSPVVTSATAGGVTSVDGRTGVVTLAAADIAAGTYPTGTFAYPGSLTVAGSAVLTTASAIAESQITSLVSDLAAKATDTLVVHKAGGDTIQSALSSTIGLIVKGAVSQAADLQQWQNSGGTVLAQFTSTGQLNLPGFQTTGAIGIAGPIPFAYSSQIGVSTHDTTAIGIVVRGVASQSADLQQWQSSGGTAYTGIDKNGHVYGTGTGPAVAALTNAGTTPPAPVLTRGSDQSGAVSFGTGTTPAAGSMVSVTFNRAYSATPNVTVTALNSATQALGLYLQSISTTGFQLYVVNAPAASQANTIYAFSYMVIG
jgi:hypothetical protein